MASVGFSTIYPILVAGRLLVALVPGISEILKYDQQLSSALTAYSRLQEGIYLFNNDIDPYSGGAFRHSPLFLSLFTTVLPNTRTSATVLWTLADILGAWALVQIWRARQGVKESARDGLVATMYLLNPYLFLPTLALSTSSFDNALTLLSIMFACQARVSPALLTLSLLFHLSPPSATLLLLPVLLILISSPLSHLASPHPLTGGTQNLKRTLPMAGEFLMYTIALGAAATLVAGGFGWITQSWGASLMLPDLTPNPGVWWYFFTEMFDHFRPFFLMVFCVHLIIYIVPMCIKFQHDPLYAAFLLVGVLGTFKAYPTLSDPGLFASMVSLFPEMFPYLRHPIVTTLLHLHASLLLPLFNHLWLNTGTGNANFFYASTLVFACANGAALIDCIWAGLRIAVDTSEVKAEGDKEGDEEKSWVVVQE